MKKLLIISILLLYGLIGFGQSSTIDSLRMRHDTLWFSDRKGSVVYFRTHGDTLYFGDVSGEYYLASFGSGGQSVDTINTRLVRFNTSVSAPAYIEGQLYYDNNLNSLALQTPGGTMYFSDSNFISLTAQSARFGTGTDTTKINSNGIDVRQSGERITIGDGAAGITFGSAGDGQIAYINYESLGFNSNMSYHSTAGVIYPNGTRLRYGTNWVPATPHVLITGDSTNIITQGEIGSFANDTLPRINVDSFYVSGDAHLNLPHAVGSADSVNYSTGTVQNVYYKISAGITWRESYRLTCAGDSVRIISAGDYKVHCWIAATTSNSSDKMRIKLFKNGSALSTSTGRFTLNSYGSGLFSPTTYYMWYVTLATNDYLSVRITNQTGARACVISDIKLYIEKMPE